MEERIKEIREEYRSVATTMGEMFIDFDSFDEMEKIAKEVDAEVYLIKCRDGERVYNVIGQQHEKYDRENDFVNECVDIFHYNEHQIITLHEIYNQCFKHRLEDAITLDEEGIEEMSDIINDFKHCRNFLKYMHSDNDIMIIDEYLSCDVIERYPMCWHEDVWEYRLALKLNED